MILGAPPRWIRMWAWVIIFASVSSMIWLFTYVDISRKITIDIKLHEVTDHFNLVDDVRCQNYNLMDEKYKNSNNYIGYVTFPNIEAIQIDSSNTEIVINDRQKPINANILKIQEFECNENTYQLLIIKIRSLPEFVKLKMRDKDILIGSITIGVKENFFEGIFLKMFN